MGNGELCPCAELPSRRWREVEIHRVDLGLGAEPADWPDAYVDLELPKALAQLPTGCRRRTEPRCSPGWWAGGGPPGLPPW